MDNFKKLIKEALTPDFLKESVNEVIEWRGKPIEMGDKFTDDDGDTFTVIEVSDGKITLQDDDGIKTTFPDDFGSHPDIRARAKFGDWFDIEESVNEGKFYPSTLIGSIESQEDIDIFDNDPFIQGMYKQGRIRVDQLDTSYKDEWELYIDKTDTEVIEFLKKNYPQHLQIDSYLAGELAGPINEEEGWHRQKKYTMDEVKREIDITIHQGEALLKYQMGFYGEIGEYEAWESLKEDLIELHQQSVVGNIEGFTSWIKNQDKNELPNMSSGSFMTGLLDIDGILGALNFEEEGEDGEDLYSDEEWTEAVNYWKPLAQKLKNVKYD